jgi:hypothetical protein
MKTPIFYSKVKIVQDGGSEISEGMIWSAETFSYLNLPVSE